MKILEDHKTTELLYGGAAGGGKTYLGCAWIGLGCLRYPGSRWGMGRAVLKHLKASTLLIFFDVMKEWGLKSGLDYNYNAQEGTVKFWNGSEVCLLELGLDPSDPEFDKLGSREYTGAFIDECSQVSTKGKNILMSRIRYKLDQFGLVPKLLLCSNPTKNFLYFDFYKPSVNKTLASYRAFVPAFVQENIYISPHYIDNLKRLDPVSKERLLHGNWEYDDDPTRLFDYECLVNMFTNAFVHKENDLRCLSADIARFGQDKTVVMIWKGMYLEKVLQYAKNSVTDNIALLNRLGIEYSIPRSRMIIDEDGVGGGVVDGLPGVKGFVNNSRPFEPIKNQERKPIIHNYANLKTQCYFALAEHVNNNEIGIYENIPAEIKEKLIEDLEQVKRHNADKDSKLQITPKEEIKEKIGRSPDYGDAMMMRMYFKIMEANKLSFGNLTIASLTNNRQKEPEKKYGFGPIKL